MKQILNSPAAFVLGSLVTAYPMDRFEQYLGILMKDPDVEIPEVLRAELAPYCEASSVEDLRSEYIDIFERGQKANSPYETEYGRHRAMAKGQELGDIAGFYRAFGFELQAGGHEMLDHVSVELEFYSLLLMKQRTFAEDGPAEATEITLDGRKKFLQAHLGRFIEAIARRPGVQESRFYSQVYCWLGELIHQECQQLGIHPDKTDWIESDQKSADNEEAANCGVKCK